ncbi:MAG: hypothetical protein OEL80_06825, partial [Desulfuromonadales bacterium]|nr:hypothetical protein [Desulfuromonadales bacterium]
MASHIRVGEHFRFGHTGRSMKHVLQISFLMVFLAALAAVAIGGNLESGLQAAESGDYKKAHKLWLLEAEQGDASAQGYLGILYANGQGVVQDDQ